MLARKFLDDWLNKVWGKKLGIAISFSRMIQRGMFVIFLKTHAMQEKVLKKGLWNVGQTLFRALPWALCSKPEQMPSNSSPFWVELQNVQPKFWPFIPHLLKPLGLVMQID